MTFLSQINLFLSIFPISVWLFLKNQVNLFVNCNASINKIAIFLNQMFHSQVTINEKKSDISASKQNILMKNSRVSFEFKFKKKLANLFDEWHMY